MSSCSTMSLTPFAAVGTAVSWESCASDFESPVCHTGLSTCNIDPTAVGRDKCDAASVMPWLVSVWPADNVCDIQLYPETGTFPTPFQCTPAVGMAGAEECIGWLEKLCANTLCCSEMPSDCRELLVALVLEPCATKINKSISTTRIMQCKKQTQWVTLSFRNTKV